MGQLIEPGSDEWSRMVSPSKVAAILGRSRYESQYACWQRLKGNAPGTKFKKQFDTGHDEEFAIAAWWRRNNPDWQLSPGPVQHVIPEEKYGYPVVCTLDRRRRRGRQFGVVEFKTARGEDAWGASFKDEPPIDYVAQVMSQMLFTGYTKVPGLLVVKNLIGCDIYQYAIPYDRSVASLIHKKCSEFWRSLDNDVPPPLDDTESTYEVVRQMHPDIDAGAVVEVDREFVDWMRGVARSADEWSDRLRGVKTTLLDQMGTAQYAQCDGVQVASRRGNGKGSVSLYITKELELTK